NGTLKMMVSSFAHCTGPLPCPPGKSPFRIKGDFYRQMNQTIDHFDQRTGGALRARLVREGLADFIGQRFLPSNYYDILPMPRFTMALAAVLGRDVHELTRRMGHSALESSTSGLYNSFLVLSVENFVTRFP